jgi:hypothetical protein
MGRTCSMHESRNTYKISVREPEGKRLLGKSKRRLEDNIKIDIKHIGMRTGFIRFGTRFNGALLWTWYWTFRFHKRQEISWQVGWLLVSREGLCSMRLVMQINLYVFGAIHWRLVTRTFVSSEADISKDKGKVASVLNEVPYHEDPFVA